jgi:hypothetical protein
MISVSYNDSNNVWHGFLLDTSGARTGNFPNRINQTNAVAGYYIDASGKAQGFTRSSGGTVTDFAVTGK